MPTKCQVGDPRLGGTYRPGGVIAKGGLICQILRYIQSDPIEVDDPRLELPEPDREFFH
jgi:hypothetical protein